MFVLQGLLGALMLGFSIILNGLRNSLEEVNKDLKGLNNAVLGQYLTRDDSDARWSAQRNLDHELRGMIQGVMVDVAQLKGTPYNYQRPAPPGVID
jgi:hypothetical protein